MAKYQKIPTLISNAEIEKNEYVLNPDLRSYEVGGQYHSNDGTPVILPEGSKIFSRILKADAELVKNLVGKDKKMSYADMAKLYPTMPYIKTLVNDDSNEVEKKTAELMLTKNANQLNSIFNAQEESKQKTSSDTLKSLLEGVNKMALGGKFQNGGNIQTLGNIKFDSNTAIQNKNGSLQVKDPINQDNTNQQNDMYASLGGTIHKYQNGAQIPINTYGAVNTGDPMYSDPRFKKLMQEGKDAQGNNVDFQDLNSTDPKTYIRQTYSNLNPTSNQVSSNNNNLYDLRQAIQGLNQTIPDTTSTTSTSNIAPSTATPKKTFDPIMGANYVNQARNLFDLATLREQPPSYNYQGQSAAYERYNPINTLAAERSYNINREDLRNSNLPQQLQASYGSDALGKVLDAQSQMAIQNQQGNIQNQNQNAQLYNNVTNQNRSQKIAYDDRFEQLRQQMLANKDQAKEKIMNNILGVNSKMAQDKVNLNLVNKLGQNYYYDGQNIQYLPGQGSHSPVNPLEQYNRNQKQELLNNLMQQANAGTFDSKMATVLEKLLDSK